jgi:hypothetical protein
MVQESKSNLLLALEHSNLLAREAINEICEECFEDGGAEEVLNAISVLLHGQVLPVSIAIKLESLAKNMTNAG